MANQHQPSEFIQYLAEHARENPDDPQLPSLNELSSILGTSVPRLREQLGAAKAMGLVDVRPRTGIKRLPYTFDQAVWSSLSYAIRVDHRQFYNFARLRIQVELAYWHEAVNALRDEDKAGLQRLLDSANAKLGGIPIRIPHAEHRELHLSIYRRLENPFVLGILGAYWDAYEAVGLSVFTDLNYHEQVWTYHQKMVAAICNDEVEAGYRALAEHTDLLALLPEASPAGDLNFI
jgi:DNA-binding FadR family transcriptional regulator